MSLSCSCQSADDADWWWVAPEDYDILVAGRARRCKSCGEKIPVGGCVTIFPRERTTSSWVEEKIHGDTLPLAPWYHCERCADLYFSLEELGFCVSPDEDMRELVKEYAEMTRR